MKPKTKAQAKIIAEFSLAMMAVAGITAASSLAGAAGGTLAGLAVYQAGLWVGFQDAAQIAFQRLAIGGASLGAIGAVGMVLKDFTFNNAMRMVQSKLRALDSKPAPG